MQRTSLSLAIVLASIASQASAGGFALNEQSISAAGTANAGRVSAVLDASTVYNNPAAMMQLKQAQFTQPLRSLMHKAKLLTLQVACLVAPPKAILCRTHLFPLVITVLETRVAGRGVWLLMVVLA